MGTTVIITQVTPPLAFSLLMILAVLVFSPVGCVPEGADPEDGQYQFFCVPEVVPCASGWTCGNIESVCVDSGTYELCRGKNPRATDTTFSCTYVVLKDRKKCPLGDDLVCGEHSECMPISGWCIKEAGSAVDASGDVVIGGHGPKTTPGDARPEIDVPPGGESGQ